MISGHVPAGLNISITHKPVNDLVAVQLSIRQLVALIIRLTRDSSINFKSPCKVLYEMNSIYPCRSLKAGASKEVPILYSLIEI